MTLPNQARAADPAVLAAFDEAAGGLARLAAAMVGPDQADDVLQEVYLAARTSPPAESTPAELRGWLYRVTVNRCRLEHRKAATSRRAMADLAARPAWAAAAPSDQAARRQEMEMVRRALGEMEFDARAMLVMRYFLGLDSRQIGQAVGLNDSTVRTRLAAGREQLANALRKMGYEHE